MNWEHDVLASASFHHAEREREIFDHIAAGFLARTESPIERALGAALIFHGLGRGIFEWAFFGPEHNEARARGFNGDVVVWTQKPVGPYFADFYLEVFYDDQVFRIIIECDGHGYHERTKEQVQHDRKRDRWMTARGFKVLRFTGSEIYQKNLALGAEIENAINRIVGLERGP